MDKIAAALVKAQRAFGPALKTSTNPHFKSRYADLSACIEAVIDGLNGAGIALVQKTHQNESGVTVETLFVHESGETLSAGLLSVPASKQDPQGYGSALTYARRYSLMSACGIAPEDDDGNSASRRPATVQAPAPQPVDPDTMKRLHASITQATDDDALVAARDKALEVAAQHKDEDAYRALRASARKRAEELKHEHASTSA